MVTFLAAILFSVSAAGHSCPKTDVVQVYILAILATEKNSSVHDKLKEIAGEVRKKDPSLTGFDLHKTINKTLKIGESEEIELIGKARVSITVNEKTDDEGRMTITVRPPKLDEITYACTCGKFFPIITNYYTSDKQRLIIAVMAKPCKAKK